MLPSNALRDQQPGQPHAFGSHYFRKSTPQLSLQRIHYDLTGYSLTRFADAEDLDAG
jgi:hypothetical protein